MSYIKIIFLISILMSSNLFSDCVTPKEEVLSEKINRFRTSNNQTILPLVMNEGKVNQKIEIPIGSERNISKINLNFYKYQYSKIILNRSEFNKRTWKAMKIKIKDNKLLIWFIEDSETLKEAIICSNKKMYDLEEMRAPYIFPVKISYYNTEQYSWLIKPKYEDFDSSGEFSEGLIAVKDEKYKWGFINESGKTVIDFKYENAQNFHNNYASINYSFLIDKTGKQIIFKDYKIQYSYLDYLLVENSKHLLFFVDKTGKELSPKYSDIGYFSDNLAVYMGKNKRNRSVYGFLDEKLKVSIKAKFSDVFSFADGLAGVKYHGKWGFIDKSGKFIIKPKYRKKIFYQFREGLAVVPIGKKFGYIDKSGKIIIAGNFDEAWGFSKDGLAAVKKGKKWGFINKHGKIVVPIKYKLVGYFSEGLAKVRVGEITGNKGAWGFIDTKGKFKISPQFAKVMDCRNGMIAVRYGAVWGIIKIK